MKEDWVEGKRGGGEDREEGRVMGIQGGDFLSLVVVVMGPPVMRCDTEGAGLSPSSPSRLDIGSTDVKLHGPQ